MVSYRFSHDFPNKTNGHSSLQGPPLPRPWASPAAAGLCDGRPRQRCCGGAEGRIHRWRWFYIKVTWGEREPVEPHPLLVGALAKSEQHLAKSGISGYEWNIIHGLPGWCFGT